MKFKGFIDMGWSLIIGASITVQCLDFREYLNKQHVFLYELDIHCAYDQFKHTEPMLMKTNLNQVDDYRAITASWLPAFNATTQEVTTTKMTNSSVTTITQTEPIKPYQALLRGPSFTKLHFDVLNPMQFYSNQPKTYLPTPFLYEDLSRKVFSLNYFGCLDGISIPIISHRRRNVPRSIYMFIHFQDKFMNLTGVEYQKEHFLRTSCYKFRAVNIQVHVPLMLGCLKYDPSEYNSTRIYHTVNCMKKAIQITSIPTRKLDQITSSLLWDHVGLESIFSKSTFAGRGRFMSHIHCLPNLFDHSNLLDYTQSVTRPQIQDALRTFSADEA